MGRTARMLLVLAVVMTAGCGVVEIPTLDQLMLRPRKEIEHTPAEYGMNYDELVVPVEEGRQVVAWHIRADQPRGLVVVLPGCTDNKGWYARFMPTFVDLGWDVLLGDYEGFGDSPGTPSLSACVDDALALTRHARSLNKTVFIYGVSFGAPLAARAADEYLVNGLILEGSLILHEEADLWLADRDLSSRLFSFIANSYARPQVPADYDILTCVARITAPKLIMHSPEDTIVPWSAGLRVFETASEPKAFWELRGDHGEMIDLEPETYSLTLSLWLEAHAEQADTPPSGPP